jgi:hypothetical protein
MVMSAHVSAYSLIVSSPSPVTKRTAPERLVVVARGRAVGRGRASADAGQCRGTVHLLQHDRAVQ